MEYEKIKQLMNDMGNSKLTEINVDFPDGTKISMKKEIKQEAVLVSQTETKLINDGSNKIENIKEIVSNSEDKKDGFI